LVIISLCLVEQLPELAALLLDWPCVYVADFADGFGRFEEVYPFICAHGLTPPLQAAWIADQVGHDGAGTDAAKAAHAVLDIGEKALAPHLTVVDDGDAGLNLLGDGRANCLLNGLG